MLMLLFTSCSFNRITESRTKRNQELLVEVTSEILKTGSKEFLVDTLTNKLLKKKLKKVNAYVVEVFNTKHPEFNQDSLILIRNHNFFLTFGEVLVDFKKEERDFSNMEGFKKVGSRVYFREYFLPIS